jgi:CHAT domain-containing protein
VLTKDGNAGQQGLDLKIYELEIKRKDLFDRAENFRRRLASRDLSFRETATELYNLLLKPAAAQLQGKTNIIIVPDGALWDLPFQALQAENNRYLVENFAISYAPSITVLREMKKLHKKGSRDEEDSATLLALGNPTLGSKVTERVKTVLMDEKLTPLPEAEKQVQGLKQLYGASHSRVYTGNEAREERIKAEAGNYRLLHLATHAILNDASPMYSQVVLSQTGGEGKEDGLLEAWELMQMNLKADLVVLSACETARGRIAAGEGVIGLSWALFVAGCPTTVVSQWKVESASTTELMLEFHRNLKPNLDGKMPGITKAEALRTAALKLMKNSEYKHPFYWAGFVMVGDGF